MGMVQAEITLKNLHDRIKAGLGLINAEDVRTATVTAVVDTGATSLVITDELRQKLGLALKGEKIARIANGQYITGKITDAVDIHWKNREITLPALVLSGNETVLLGALPLEGMDLMVNPVTQELAGVHGDREEYVVYQNF